MEVSNCSFIDPKERPLELHPMIDIETWDNERSAVIRAAAVVLFDPHTGQIHQRTSINARASVDDQLERGRTINDATWQFWQRMARESYVLSQALKSHREDPDIITGEAETTTELTALLRQALAGRSDESRVWSRGYFDQVILEHLFRSVDEPLPWPWWQVADVRTLDMWIPKVMPQIKHDPISDAEAQVAHVMAMSTIVSMPRIDMAKLDAQV